MIDPLQDLGFARGQMRIRRRLRRRRLRDQFQQAPRDHRVDRRAAALQAAQVHRQFDVLGVLQQVADGTLAQGGEDGLLLRPRGHHDRGQVGMPGAQPFDEVDAVAVRQLHVDQGQAVPARVGGEPRRGLGPAAREGGAHRSPRPLEPAGARGEVALERRDVRHGPEAPDLLVDGGDVAGGVGLAQLGQHGGVLAEA